MKKYTGYTLMMIAVAIFFSHCNNANEEAKGEEQAYSEQHRPQFHFTPPTQWMNDPNGMVYYEGEYHLFYQYYPDSNVWGPMHWGHAVSEDLVTWEQLPIALYPDSLGLIFSGSAVVDWNNTSGFQTGENPPLIAIYTYHLMEGEKAGRNDFQYQAIAYSNDKGRTWTKYEGNPVIPNAEGQRDFRDPKVSWHEATKQWVMIFAVLDRVRIYNSPDLKTWTLASEFGAGLGSEGRPWECPDLFELKIEGTDETRWVMLVSLGKGGYNGGSATQYFIGDFDGKRFTVDKGHTTLWIDYGRDNYAGVTWSDIPKKDGRRIFLGWMSNWQYATKVPTTAWRSAMTLPRVLSLRQTASGLRLIATPVAEVADLRTTKEGQQLTSKMPFSGQAEATVVFEMETGSSANFGIELSNAKGETYRIGYNAATNQYFSDRTKAGKKDFSEEFAAAVHLAPRIEKGNIITLRCFFDVSSAESFADGGATIFTDIFFPNEDFNQINVFQNEGKVTIQSATLYDMKRIW